MAYLEHFSGHDLDLLVALPYRAGLFVSSSDAQGEKKADAEELKVLHDLIEAQAKGMYESAFVHEIMVETFARRTDWRSWGDHLDSVPGECRNAILMLSHLVPPGKIQQRDIDALKGILLQIGLDVAKAYREYDRNESWTARFYRRLGIMVDGLLGIVRGEHYSSSELLNISYEEDIALNALAEALRADLVAQVEKTTLHTGETIPHA
ncbi:hypothetical protein [Micavibrio aeruginosavorus]|uniref:hypothetical protein n=1 Tax=Micavibrio aeruginosavorus TaxID=349221 RepID=UPI003F4ACAAF